jgi:hypothetical protein
MRELRTPEVVPEPEQPSGAPTEPGQGWRQISTDMDRAGSSRAAERESARVDKRRDLRLPLRLPVTTATIDAVRDPVTGDRVFQTSEDDSTLDVSRRGLCLRFSHPPAIGTRVLLQLRLPEDVDAIELVARTRWTRVEFEPGEAGARPICRVGLELLAGAPRALARFERSVRQLQDPA